MKQKLLNNLTGVVEEIEVKELLLTTDELPLVEEVPLDVRVSRVEQEQEQIVDVLAEILGV